MIYDQTLRQLIDAGTISTGDKVLVVCGGSYDADVLQGLGLATGDKARLNEALSAVNGALEVYQASHIESRIARAERLRTSILAALASKPAPDATSPRAPASGQRPAR